MAIVNQLDNIESLELRRCKLKASDLHTIFKKFNNSVESLVVKNLEYTDVFGPLKKDCQRLKKLKSLEVEGNWTIFKHLKNVQLTKIDCEVSHKNTELEQMTEFMNFMGRQTELTHVRFSGISATILFQQDVSKLFRFKMEHLDIYIFESMTSSFYAENFLKFLRSQKATLKSLDLFTCFENTNQDELMPLILYELPQLKRFSMFMDDFIFPKHTLYKDNSTVTEFSFHKSFSHRRVRGHERRLIGCMKNLQKLQLDCLKIDPKLVTVLKGLKCLIEIKWNDCLFDEEVALASVSSMEFETITELQKMLDILKSNPQLKELRLNTWDYGNINVDMEGFGEIFRTLKNLEVLDLKWYTHVADVIGHDNFAEFVARSSLKILKLPDCMQGKNGTARLHGVVQVYFIERKY